VPLLLVALLAFNLALVTPASARYDLPQDYLDALADALPNAAAGEIPGSVAPLPTTHCDLFMELQGQVLHVVVKSCLMQFDERLHVSSRQPKCSTHLTSIEQTDHVTWLVFFVDSGTDCESTTHQQRALQFQLVGDDVLRITNAEAY
jgi:hypothetical protein